MRFLWTIIAVLTLGSLSNHVNAQEIQWTKTFSGAGDGAWAVATEDASIYVLSADNTVVRKTDVNGNVVWTAPALGNGIDGFAIAVHDTGIYVAGGLRGTLPGQVALGASDAFLSKYDRNGNLLWSRQFGTADGEAAFGVAVTDQGVYVTGGQSVPFLGGPSSAFLGKFDFNGNELWRRTYADGSTYGFSVAASNDSVYVAGTQSGLRGAFVRRYDSEGGAVWTRTFAGQSPSLINVARSVAIDETGSDVFVGGIFDSSSWSNTFRGHWQSDSDAKGFIVKFDQDGTLLWRRMAANGNSNQVYGVTTGENSVYAAGFIDIIDEFGTEVGEQSFVTRFDNDGSRRWSRRFSADAYSQGKAVALLDDAIVVAGHTTSVPRANASQFQTMLTKLTEPPPRYTDYRLLNIGDVNGDSTPELGVFVDGNPKVLIIKDIATGLTINRLVLSEAGATADIGVMPDLDANGAPEVIWLSKNPIRAKLYDTLQGELVADYGFDRGFEGIDLELVADENGNAVMEIAVLEQGSLRAEVRDGLTGDVITNVYFNPNFLGRQLIALPDLNGNRSADIGLLSLENPVEGSDKVEIRDIGSREVINQVWLGNASTAREVVTVPDRNGNGSPELAVLRVQASTGYVNVLIVDPLDSTRFAKISYNSNFDILRLVSIDDINSNGFPEMGVLGTHRDNGSVRIEIRDSGTHEFITAVYFNSAFSPQDVVTLSDIDGNGAPELALLGRRPIDGLLRIMVYDALTARRLTSVNVFQ